MIQLDRRNFALRSSVFRCTRDKFVLSISSDKGEKNQSGRKMDGANDKRKRFISFLSTFDRPEENS